MFAMKKTFIFYYTWIMSLHHHGTNEEKSRDNRCYPYEKQRMTTMALFEFSLLKKFIKHSYLCCCLLRVKIIVLTCEF